MQHKQYSQAFTKSRMAACALCDCKIKEISKCFKFDDDVQSIVAILTASRCSLDCMREVYRQFQMHNIFFADNWFFMDEASCIINIVNSIKWFDAIIKHLHSDKAQWLRDICFYCHRHELTATSTFRLIKSTIEPPNYIWTSQGFQFKQDKIFDWIRMTSFCLFDLDSLQYLYKHVKTLVTGRQLDHMLKYYNDHLKSLNGRDIMAATRCLRFVSECYARQGRKFREARIPQLGAIYKIVTEHSAANLIQECWRRCIENPEYRLCKDRLDREYCEIIEQ